MHWSFDPTVATVASVAGHLALILALQSAPSSGGAVQLPSELRLDSIPVVVEASGPPAAEPKEALEEPAAPRRTSTPRLQARPRRPAEKPVTDPPVQETPEEMAVFSGITLSNQAGTWAAAAGDGSEGPGIVGPGQRANSPSGDESGIGSQTGGTGRRLVPLGQLSRPPRQPNDLAVRLERLYPDEARAQGVEGTARVRIRVAAGGTVQSLAVLQATLPAFGRACRRLLHRSQGWRPGLDARGEPVDTLLEFPCRFELRP